MSLQRLSEEQIRQTLFKVHNKYTDIVSVSLLPTLNNIWLCLYLKYIFKILKCSIYTKLQNTEYKKLG